MGYGKSLRGTPDEISKRRSMIKKWILDEGLTNREEMLRRLKDEGIVVTRQTVYNDIKAVANISSDELKEFELDIMGQFKKLIRELDIMIAGETDNKLKATLIKTLSTVMKDRHQVAQSISAHGEPKTKKQKQDTSEVNISFG